MLHDVAARDGGEVRCSSSDGIDLVTETRDQVDSSNFGDYWCGQRAPHKIPTIPAPASRFPGYPRELFACFPGGVASPSSFLPAAPDVHQLPDLALL